MRIDLPQGQWAELRDPRVVTERRRRPAKTALYAVAKLAEAEATVEAIEAWDDLRVQVAVALIDQWSVNVDVTVDAILDLPGDVYDALLTAVEPQIMALLPSFGAGGVTDPKALTDSSASSVPG